MDKDNFDLEKLFKEPNFNVDAQVYVNRYKELLKEIDSYIKQLKDKLKNERGLSKFGCMGELIFAEYQRETIEQVMKDLDYHSR